MLTLVSDSTTHQLLTDLISVTIVMSMSITFSIGFVAGIKLASLLST